MTNYAPVMPHGSIEEIANDVFWVQGSIQFAPGMRLTRNMAIVRSGEELTVVSPVRLSPTGEAELERLGKVRHVVKIGFFHGVDDAYYLERFGATYWALPDGARSQDPRPDEELRRIQDIVANAVGYDPQRRDSINVSSLPFKSIER